MQIASESMPIVSETIQMILGSTLVASVVRAVELWISVFPLTAIGILVASIAVEFGIFDRLFPVMKPFLYGAHFTPHSGIAFMTAFGSPIAAVAMISEFYGEGKIDQKETLLATVATWFPQTIYESLVYISPTIVPVLGVVGIAYLSLFVLNGTIVAFIMFLAGRALLTQKNFEFEAETEGRNTENGKKGDWKPEDRISEDRKPGIKPALKRSVLNSMKLLRRVVLVAFPVSIFVFVLIDLGVFDAFQYPGLMPLPPEALAVVPLVVANPTAAYVTVADLMDTEVLDFKLALLTLLAGNLRQYPVSPYSQASVLLRDLRACTEPENNLSKRRAAPRADRLNDSCSGAGFMMGCSAVRLLSSARSPSISDYFLLPGSFLISGRFQQLSDKNAILV